MKKLLLCLSVLLCAAPVLRAGFEGTIDMKMTSPGGGGTMRVAVGKAGSRSDVTMGIKGMTMTQSTLVKASEPGKVYRINDAAKSYTVVNMKTDRAAAAKMNEEYTVEKLGVEKVGGYDCAHVRVTGSRGQKAELWTTKDIGSFGTASRLMGERSGVEPGFEKSLRDADADGFPVKSIHFGPRGENITMELVSVSKKAPPAARFEIPAGYAERSDAMMPAGMNMPPEAAKAMEDMSPEQREMMEKMMNRR